MRRPKVIGMSELTCWVRSSVPDGPEKMILLIGDRLRCCDEAIVVRVKGEIVSVATIAPNGEDFMGDPTIVAIYTLPEYRNCGMATMVLEGAIARCRARGFERVHIDVMSNHVIRIIANLPRAFREYLDVNDQGDVFSLF